MPFLLILSSCKLLLGATAITINPLLNKKLIKAQSLQESFFSNQNTAKKLNKGK
jgi:hypothetical protein